MTFTSTLLKASSQRATTATGFEPIEHLRAVLAGVGMTPEDGGGRVDFIGSDPVIPSVFRIAGAAGIGLVAKSVAMASLWRERTGEGQDIAIDIRKAPHRLCPFYDRKWELLNGYPPKNTADPGSPFSLAFYEAKDGRWVMPLNIYPRLKTSALRLLGVPDDAPAIAKAIKGWDALSLEEAGAAAGIVMPMLRSIEELIGEVQYTNVLQGLPLIEIEKIGESDPIPFSANPTQPLSGIKALGFAHVIAGAGTGRALALHGADVLNIWRPKSYEIEPLYATANVGVRSALLDIDAAEGRAVFTQLAKDADVFYANRRYGTLDRYGASPEELASLRPGIIHATVSLHGQAGPWAIRPGFDQSAGCVTGVMTLEGDPTAPKLPFIQVVNDYLAAWMLTTGVVAALKRRAKEGGSYRVHVSLTRLSLWLYTLGLFDKQFAHETAGQGEEHLYLAPDLFTASTPMGDYQGVADQVKMSRTPGSFRFALVPRGSSRPAWAD